MSFFTQFPKIKYPYQGKMVGDGRSTLSSVECVDLMVRYRIKEEILQSPLSYYTYTWKDNDRPDTVAFDYYGSTDYAWLVIYSAQVFDYLYDFPMAYREFLDYLADSYEVEDPYTLQGVLHHYEDGEGYTLDEASYISSTDSDKKEVSVFEYESIENERRRKVKLLSRKFLQDITQEFEENLKSIKADRKANLSEFILTK